MGVSWVLFGALLAASPVVAPPAVGPAVDVGAIWERRCQNCHGADGKAHTRTGQRESIDDFTETVWQNANTDEHIRTTIAEGSKGNAKMKAYKTLLTPDEIEALVAYIRWLSFHSGGDPQASGQASE